MDSEGHRLEGDLRREGGRRGEETLGDTASSEVIPVNSGDTQVSSAVGEPSFGAGVHLEASFGAGVHLAAVAGAVTK